MVTDRPRTLGELRASGYRMESVKDEMRRNLVRKIRGGETPFPDILGYEVTVVLRGRSRTPSSRGTTCSSSASAARPRPGCSASS